MFENLLRLTEGATLALDLFVADDLGQAVNWSAGELTMTVADLFGDLVASPTVTPSAEPGWGTIVASTTGWPLGRLAAQLVLTVAGVVTISEAFPITIKGAVA